MGTSIILADDHKIIREGLRVLLESEPDFRVVGEAANGRKAIELVDKLHPDIVIMDVTMPDMNGIEATRIITKQTPATKVLGLSIHSDRQFVIAMLKVGARGYLIKRCAFDELITAIQTVLDKQIYLSPKITDVVVKELNTKSGIFPEDSALTTRERQVLQLLSEGKSVKQIAPQLHISISTVETHRRKIMAKLDLHNLPELTKYAIRHGITTLDN